MRQKSQEGVSGLDPHIIFSDKNLSTLFSKVMVRRSVSKKRSLKRERKSPTKIRPPSHRPQNINFEAKRPGKQYSQPKSKKLMKSKVVVGRTVKKRNYSIGEDSSILKSSKTYDGRKVSTKRRGKKTPLTSRRVSDKFTTSTSALKQKIM